MKYLHHIFIGALLFSCIGLWGCTQQKTGAINAKIHDLESRYTKLEEDYRFLQASSEQVRKRLAQTESQRAALEKQKNDLAKQLESTETEREEFRNQIAQRTKERDNAQSNLTQFSKELQALAGRVESALNQSPQNPNLAVVPASRRTE